MIQAPFLMKTTLKKFNEKWKCNTIPFQQELTYSVGMSKTHTSLDITIAITAITALLYYPLLHYI